ncbi:MAG TPA: c-type cytochrome [Gemmataceae bacterium]|jgi:mono/diheme cytochrome c family protein
MSRLHSLDEPDPVQQYMSRRFPGRERLGPLALLLLYPFSERPSMEPIRSLDDPDPVQEYMLVRSRKRWIVLGAVVFLIVVAVFWSIFAEVPPDYADIRDHFKYGSIGSDSAAGIPYWIWWVLPDLFPQHLPEPERYKSLPDADRTPPAAYAQFGFVYEAGHDLPIGFSKRRVTVERVGLNCAVCHVATLKITPGMDPSKIYGGEPDYTSPGKDRLIILGMPAITVDLGGYLQFLFKCADDPGFTDENILDAINRHHHLGPLDRFLYRRAVPALQKALQDQERDFVFLGKNPPAGPGRVDTFNPYKNHVFHFPPDGSIGTADLPSIWNQRPREGMQLHWDGNNTSVFERNISASLGAGATPVSLDMPRMLRVAAWLGAPDPHRVLTEEEKRIARADPRPHTGELPIPRFPYAIDPARVTHGGALYARHCASCHDWQGKHVGQTVPADEIGTDRQRLDSFTPELAANQNTLGAGQWWRFHNFRKTDGYVNMPLDGLWARAPYLHNGSVPTLLDLLQKPGSRARKFFRGDDEYDPVNVGFRSDRSRSDDGRRLFPFDTELPGNGNGGHDYGTSLADEEKKALLEYLKTL